jgi:2,3-bisphosphoglycerate-independent phosphoglycerate mutase
MDLNFIRKLVVHNENKIVLLVMDGLGGAPMEEGGPTELESASTPNLDALAARGICGLHMPVGPGITPGSGPAHLGLFGYDPVRYQVGRGVLAALGIEFDLQSGDVAARGNFCTINQDGYVTDRRAGRIETEVNKKLCSLLQDIHIEGIDTFIETVKEHRFLLVLRGQDLSSQLADTDPHRTGRRALDPEPLREEASATADKLAEFIDGARDKLRDQGPANMVLLRGFSKKPEWPSMESVFGLKAAAIARYPMYWGVSRLVGMDALDGGSTLEDQVGRLRSEWDRYDYFYLHVKKIDSDGEDGNFEAKVRSIELVDQVIPEIESLNPEVLIVTGDHSTPARFKSHSWHPVPVVLFSRACRPDRVERFGERACIQGALGPRIPSVELMPIALANARRLLKFGA